MRPEARLWDLASGQLIEAVRREKLAISGVCAMHTGVTPWKVIEVAVAKANAAR